MNKPYFSIIIPTYNEETLLPRLLKSLERQTYQDYEVIVADNHSTDDTLKILKQFDVKIVEGANRPGIARNHGATFASGEYLVFLDADTAVHADFLEKLLKQIKLKNFAAASGFFVGDKGNGFDRFTHAFLNNYFWALQKVDPHACGFYFVAKRDIFMKLKGFDPKIVMAEDHELAYRISKVGKFCFLRKPTIKVSVRRISREGRLRTIGNGIYVELYRIFNKRITKKLFDYEMGGVDEK